MRALYSWGFILSSLASLSFWGLAVYSHVRKQPRQVQFLIAFLVLAALATFLGLLAQV